MHTEKIFSYSLSGVHIITKSHSDIFLSIFFISKNLIELEPYNFKGLKNVTVIKENNTYKYFFSNSTNFDDITKKKNKAIEKH